jgi:asparagine synthase (glutamine-hydrolysing)
VRAGPVPDEERYYAELAARALDIPAHFLRADGYRIYEGWDRAELRTPEPYNGPCLWTFQELQRQIAAYSRVALTGYGADPAMHGSATYVASLLKSRAWGRLAVDLWHSVSRGRVPKVGFRARLRRWSGQAWRPRPLPAWLHPGFAARLDLPARHRRFTERRPSKHPRRPEAWSELTNSFWPYRLEDNDPGVTGFPIEHRHPFFDLRVLTWLLAIPPVPWCDHKEVLRSAVARIIPEPVRVRPKAGCSAQGILALPMPLTVPLGKRRALPADDPICAMLRRAESAWVDRFEAVPELAEYVLREQIPPVCGEVDNLAIWANLRPLSLNFWLRYSLRKSKGGTGNGFRATIQQAG